MSTDITSPRTYPIPLNEGWLWNTLRGVIAGLAAAGAATVCTAVDTTEDESAFTPVLSTDVTTVDYFSFNALCRLSGFLAKLSLFVERMLVRRRWKLNALGDSQQTQQRLTNIVFAHSKGKFRP